MSRLPFPPAHGNKVGRPGKGQPPCRGGSVIKLDVLATNFAKACVASLILVLLDASVPPAMGEIEAPKRELVLAVTGHVRVSRVHAMDEASDDAKKKASGVVIWLVPTQTSQKGRPALESPHYQVVQRNKTFEPRLLVVPAGSIVDFPTRGARMPQQKHSQQHTTPSPSGTIAGVYRQLISLFPSRSQG